MDGLLLGMTSKPWRCHMTSSVNTFEVKSVASTSSRYGVESRHQQAQHNISDKLEPIGLVMQTDVVFCVLLGEARLQD